MTEKLDRKVMKIYGENAAARDIIAYGSDIAGDIVQTKDPDAIQNSAYVNGVRDAIIGQNSTTLQNRQTLDYLFSRQLKYLFQKGIPEWKDTETYYNGSFVSDGNGKIYFSKVDDNIGNDLEDKTKWKEFIPGGGGLPIGAVYYSEFGTVTQNPGALPLFTGETISNAEEIYPEFYAAILADTGLQCTAEEYEAALTKYGECPKYVIGVGSLRLPLLKNYIKAANTTEGVKNISAGLPNLTWNLTVGEGTFSSISPEIVLSGGQKIAGGNNWVTNVTADYSAQRGNPIYGNSDTVTPPSTTLYPWVVAYAAAIPASTAQAAEFQQGLSGKADTNLGNIPSNYDYVVESYKDDQGNWYRKYKSGWVEQGGYGKGNITFLKPYSSLPNVITGSANKTGDGWPARANEVTATGFYLYGGNQDTVSAYWEAKGQGGENV